MMRKLLLQTIAMKDQQGKERTYEYSILVDEMDVGTFSCESYGLQVTELGSGEKCEVPHITTSISRIDELSQLVMAGGVTPVTLADVVSDWL